MKQVCDFCGGYITDTDETCPHCGAPNSQYQREANKVPRTIGELQQWYDDHNLPPKEVTRFFIGENYKQPRAFGIYQEGERFIVYKNKDDGSRAIRYDGSDEAYAVNELYMKLKERIAEEKAKNSGHGSGSQNKKKNNSEGKAIVGLILFILVGAIITGILEKDRGYYVYNGNTYYNLSNDWYIYDDYNDYWYTTDVDDELNENYKDYYQSESYSDSYGTSDFEDTSYYEEWSSSDWDSDSSWSSSDSWDSGGGDWGSDW